MEENANAYHILEFGRDPADFKIKIMGAGKRITAALTYKKTCTCCIRALDEIWERGSECETDMAALDSLYCKTKELLAEVEAKLDAECAERQRRHNREA